MESPANNFDWDDIDGIKRNPQIHHAHLQDDFGDDPNKHRWRAWWTSDFYGATDGIELRAYPVLRLTPTGAWIDHLAHREHTKDGLDWWLSGEKRWVSNTGGAAFAKPTQAEAMYSLAYRLMRWRQKVIKDVNHIRTAAEVCKALLPEHAHFAQGIEGPF